jgi:CRP/FNR family cyclic AMP-dependent transcriptional regulator
MDPSSARAEAAGAAADVQGKEQVVQRSPLSSLGGESRAALLALGALERLPRRHAVAAQGEPARRFVLIGAGRVKVERRSGDRALPLGHRGPGQMVGETALAGAAVEVASESAIVVDEVTALSFPIGDLRRRLASDAALRAAVAAAIVEQQRAVEARVEGLLLQPVEARLAAFLLDAVDRWGQPHAEGRVISAPFTHAEIALLIGSTRETVTLVLGKLKREGICAFDHRRVIVHDPARLAQHAPGREPPPGPLARGP